MDNIYIVTAFAEKGDLSVVNVLTYAGNWKSSPEGEEVYGGWTVGHFLGTCLCNKVSALEEYHP